MVSLARGQRWTSEGSARLTRYAAVAAGLQPQRQPATTPAGVEGVEGQPRMGVVRRAEAVVELARRVEHELLDTSGRAVDLDEGDVLPPAAARAREGSSRRWSAPARPRRPATRRTARRSASSPTSSEGSHIAQADRRHTSAFPPRPRSTAAAKRAREPTSCTNRTRPSVRAETRTASVSSHHCSLWSSPDWRAVSGVGSHIALLVRGGLPGGVDASVARQGVAHGGHRAVAVRRTVAHVVGDDESGRGQCRDPDEPHEHLDLLARPAGHHA